MNKGFVIVAQNTYKTDYVKCAEVLATSIKKVMPKAKVTLISDNITFNEIFDSVVKFPYGDLNPLGEWKLANDWQVYKASPYEYTIKLEADMYLPKSIDYWWDVLCQKDLVVSSTIRNFKQEISDVRVYRKLIDDNKLPDVYNAITYFKKGDLAEKFFRIVRDVFENWIRTNFEFTLPQKNCIVNIKAIGSFATYDEMIIKPSSNAIVTHQLDSNFFMYNNYPIEQQLY